MEERETPKNYKSRKNRVICLSSVLMQCVCCNKAFASLFFYFLMEELMLNVAIRVKAVVCVCDTDTTQTFEIEIKCEK